jgi:hypothetical protein
MFENISIVAEKLATNVGESRRGFLGRLGKVALGAAGVLLVLSGNASAESTVCIYRCPDGSVCYFLTHHSVPRELACRGMTCKFYKCGDF